MSQLITCWYRAVETHGGNDRRLTGKLKFNHISDGFDPAAIEPKPTNDYQKKCWRDAWWVPVKAQLINGVVKELT